MSLTPFASSRARGLLCFTGAFLSYGLASCADRHAEALREWRPSDHQPPPVAIPDGQGAGASDGVAPEQSAALALWGMRCAGCHGAEGRGDGPQRPAGASMPDMTLDAFHSARSDAQLSIVIAQGKGLMPPFNAELTEQAITALVGHVRTLNANQAARAR